MKSSLIKQISGTVLLSENNWDFNSQKELSEFTPPDILIGTRKDVLKGDISREWARWIIEQFIDSKFLNNEVNFIKVYSEIKQNINYLVGIALSNEEKEDICQHLSSIVLDRITFIKKDREKRKGINKKTKEELLFLYSTDDEVRCWLTGYKFSKEAIHNFTCSKDEKMNIKLPTFVDKYRPIGRNERDLTIEIDHLHPFSYGGEDHIDNFRLICGWANITKSNNISGYSKGTTIRGSNQLFPNNYYYWALRVIGLRRKCEEDGCTNNIYNSELTICSRLGPNKAITPVSMKVICKKHDTRKNRYIDRLSTKEWVNI